MPCLHYTPERGWHNVPHDWDAGSGQCQRCGASQLGPLGTVDQAIKKKAWAKLKATLGVVPVSIVPDPIGTEALTARMRPQRPTGPPPLPPPPPLDLQTNTRLIDWGGLE